MKAKLRLMRGLIGLGGALLIAAPSPALAHDNLGGDELAVANWMLIAAVVVIVMGILAGIWAAKTGQFTNVEESKYRMLANADDFDAIMAEADARAAASRSPESPVHSPESPGPDFGPRTHESGLREAAVK